MNIQQMIDECLAVLGVSRADATVAAYRKGLQKFVEYLAVQDIHAPDPVTEINMEHFIGYPSWVLSQGYKKSTVQVYINATNALLDYLLIRGLLEPDYADMSRLKRANKLVARKREDKLVRFPNRGDVPKMKAAVRDVDYPDVARYRNIAIVEVLASTGCRVSEITGLTVGDFHDDYRVAVVTGKGSKERFVYFSDAARKALVKYWIARGYADPADPAFCRHDKGAGENILPITPTTVRSIIREVADAAGIEKFSPHYFRHAFAIKALSKSGNLALVQDYLGHASPASTRVYAKIYPDEMKAKHAEIFE